MVKYKRLLLSTFAIAALGLLSLQANAATVTGLDFLGGCPSPTSLPDSTVCDASGQPSAYLISVITGVDESLIVEGDKVDAIKDVADYVTDDFLLTLDLNAEGEATTGTFVVLDASVTYLTFKADSFFILAEFTGEVGVVYDWSTDPSDWLTILDVYCPALICGTERFYTLEDFYNTGTNIAAISNVVAWSVVPVPAAVWLFGSALLGLVGVARRKAKVA